MKVTAILDGLEFELFKTRSKEDRRRRVDQYVYSYRYEQYEWRKSFEVPVGATRPVPPRTMQVQL